MLFAQVINVPKKSQEWFENEHPAASKVKWTNNVANYTVKYKEGGVDYSTRFSIDGDWNYTEKSVSKEAVPDSVQTTFNNSKYRDWTLKSLKFIEDKDNKSYRYEVKKGIENMYVFILPDGKVLKESMTL